MLSEAKHLYAPKARPFAALRVTVGAGVVWQGGGEACLAQRPGRGRRKRPGHSPRPLPPLRVSLPIMSGSQNRTLTKDDVSLSCTEVQPGFWHIVQCAEAELELSCDQ